MEVKMEVKMENNEKVVRAMPRVTGAGVITSDLYQVEGDEGGPRCYLKVHLDSGPVVRLRLWGDPEDQVEEGFPRGDLRGVRVGFSGLLREPYDGISTIAVELGALRWGAR
jgi:hypothetical protein